MDDEVIEGEKQDEEEVGKVSDVELAGDGDTTVGVEDLVDKILDDDNVGAKKDFEDLIAAKLNDLLDARKQSIAQSLYSDSEEEVEGQEEVTVDTADTEEE